MQNTSAKKRAAFISVVSNASLVILKLAVGVISGSVSIISEAIHSGMDLVASFIALYAVMESAKPPDTEHEFGHGKFEDVSGLAEALLIFIAAIWIIHEAAHKLMYPKPLEFVSLGVLVMLLSSVVNFAVSKMLFKVGKATDSVALIADAWHLRTDVYTCAGIMAALSLYYAAQKLLPNLDLLWIDPLIAIAVAALIMKAAYKLTIASLKELTDQSLPASENELIKSKIIEFPPKVFSYANLKTRKAGPTRFISLDLIVDAGMPVEEAHKATDDITARLDTALPGSAVTIHVEPCKNNCSPDCLKNCVIKT